MKYVYYPQQTWVDVILMAEDYIWYIIFMRLKTGKSILFKKKNIC